MFRTCLDLLHTYATVTTLVCDKICCFLVISFLYSNVKPSGFEDCEYHIEHNTPSLLIYDVVCLQFPPDYVQQNRSYEWQSWLQSIVQDSSTKKYECDYIFLMLLFCPVLFLEEDELALTGLNLIMISHGKEM